MDAELTRACIETYRELRNLKLVGARLGIPWQTVYVHLRRAGEPVTGDKTRYGSETDRLAARGERWFQRAVPFAIDNNDRQFQAKVDFVVNGWTVDVKVSRPKNSKRGVTSWMWSVKKQELVADYFLCAALTGEGNGLSVYRALLIPGEMARHYVTIRTSLFGDKHRGKWWDYAIKDTELAKFFMDLGPRSAVAA